MKNKNVPTTHDSRLTTQRSAVWTFTNKIQLNKNQFINYIERKVFRTIRKYNLLPKNKTFTLKKSNSLNTQVLKKIIETKFQVKLVPISYSLFPITSAANLSQIAEDTFKKILKGNFTSSLHPPSSPLLFVSDKELELYATLKNIKGVKRKENKKIQTLFQKFLTKNQDLELNIIKATKQIK